MASLTEELAQAPILGPTALTIGVFDGVHLGHQHLIQRLVASSRQRGLTPVVITFVNHPRTVLRPGEPMAWLTSLDDRLELLRLTGVARVIPITFTQEVSQVTAEEFVRMLRDKLNMTHMVVGPDFALGNRRQGTYDFLKALGPKVGFDIEQVEPFRLHGEEINSTAIRQALAQGDIQRVNRFLGRSFSFTSSVEHGEGRGGSALGFPTINLSRRPDEATPGEGVYAAWVIIGGKRHMAAASIGIKPTFHDHGPQVVEAFILDFSGDLYGKTVRMEFIERLRGQEKYDSAEALIAQMRRDVETARQVLTAAAKTPRSSSGL